MESPSESPLSVLLRRTYRSRQVIIIPIPSEGPSVTPVPVVSVSRLQADPHITPFLPVKHSNLQKCALNSSTTCLKSNNTLKHLKTKQRTKRKFLIDNHCYSMRLIHPFKSSYLIPSTTFERKLPLFSNR